MKHAFIWATSAICIILAIGTAAPPPVENDPVITYKVDKETKVSKKLSEWIVETRSTDEKVKDHATRAIGERLALYKISNGKATLTPVALRTILKRLLEMGEATTNPDTLTGILQHLSYAPAPLDPDVRRFGFEKLKHGDPDVVMFALQMFQPDHVRDQEVIKATTSLLNSSDDGVRQQAVQLMWYAKELARPALPELEKLMRDDRTGMVRCKSALAYYQLTGNADASVISLWNWLDEIPEDRGDRDLMGELLVYHALGELGPKAKPISQFLARKYRHNRELAKQHPDLKEYLDEKAPQLLEVLLKIDPERGIPLLPDAPAPPAGFPKFKVQEIDTALKIGYAVILEDINGDKKPDIVVVDQHKIVWYENPTWKKRVILDGKTKPDNVCICAMDIDGNGDLELVVGAAWKPFDTKNAATLQWLKRGKTLDDEWTMYPIHNDEPTIHRIRAIDVDGDGKPELVSAPLMGRDATKEKNWMDGRPVRVTAYKIPAEPTKAENWKPELLSEELHVIHNFAPFTQPGAKKPMSIITSSYEGYSAIILGEGGKKHQTNLVHEGNQKNTNSNRGASEIKSGWLKDGAGVVATIEPWHGNEVVVYTGKKGEKPKRTVLDDHLRWGHGVSFGDLDGDGSDELVIGVRDNPNKTDTFKEQRGVRLYRNTGEKWERYILDDGGVAVEDLAVGDLNGDGKPDIVAVGRATGNTRIYWNQGK